MHQKNYHSLSGRGKIPAVAASSTSDIFRFGKQPSGSIEGVNTDRKESLVSGTIPSREINSGYESITKHKRHATLS